MTFLCSPRVIRYPSYPQYRKKDVPFGINSCFNNNNNPNNNNNNINNHNNHYYYHYYYYYYSDNDNGIDNPLRPGQLFNFLATS